MDKLGDILRDGTGVNLFIDDVRRAIREAYEAEADVCEEHEDVRYARAMRAEGKKVDKLLAKAQKAVDELAG
jgi:pyridoxine 5'-phosphate synthase PdxJ